MSLLGMSPLWATALLLAVAAVPATAQSATDFDGTWDGQITFFNIPGQFLPPGTAQLHMRLQISGDDVHVFCCNDMHEIKRGEFEIDSDKTNAVIYATNSGDQWVETWNFTFTLRGDGTMQVIYSRAVNNTQTPLSDPTSKFTTAGYGRFKRLR